MWVVRVALQRPYSFVVLALLIDGGLNPVNRGDMPMAWCARAGLSARHAPLAVEPGPRSFWRATQDADFCAEGSPRQRAEASAPS
jgi:hypothetical protein